MLTDTEKDQIGLQGRLLRIMIGAPGDLAAEVDIVREEIEHWNNQHAQAERIFLLFQHWRTNSHPRLGDSGQETINKQLVRNSDLLIAMFRSRLGTPTENAPSGTAEEIKEIHNAGKSVKVYFGPNIIDQDSPGSELANTESRRLKVFKEDLEKAGLRGSYKNLDDFRKQITSHLYMEVRSLKSENFLVRQNRPIITSVLNMEEFKSINTTNWEERAKNISIYIIENAMKNKSSRLSLKPTEVIKVFQIVLFNPLRSIKLREIHSFISSVILAPEFTL